MSYKETWLNSCFGSNANDRIEVHFKDGREPARYTMDVFDMLKEDSAVDCILSDQTGEILYCCD